MKIALAQQSFLLGDVESNFEIIKSAVETASQKGADLTVFSELSLVGGIPEDLLFYDSLLEKQNAVWSKLLELSHKSAIIIGGIEKVSDKYLNTAFFISEGEIKFKKHKTAIQNFDIYNESRFVASPFSENEETFDFKGLRLCLTIGGDLGNLNFSEIENSLIINLRAVPFGIEEDNFLDKISSLANANKVSILSVNQAGANTELVYSGNSFAVNTSGNVLTNLPFFEDALHIVDLKNSECCFQSKPFVNLQKIEKIQKALEKGIKDYFQKNGFKKAVLGSSGGIDSALVQTLISNAIGSENVTAILMPSEFSSLGSVTDAEELSQNLGNPYHIVPIKDIYKQFLQTMKNVYGETSFDVTEENIQARVRANILMAFSNKKGALVINSSNKSELAVGYGTLYGDLCGALSVIGDLYKTEVYELAKFINREKEIIPNNIITKEPSAELRPEQKDSDSLPDYDILDSVLKMFLEEGRSEDFIISCSFEKDIVKRILSLVKRNEHKRFQAPPILRISKKAFGRGRIMPISSKY